MAGNNLFVKIFIYEDNNFYLKVTNFYNILDIYLRR